MFLRQMHLESLGHASYVVGSERTGEALVLDPRRDAQVYLDAAADAGLRITHVLDSHGHNDYVSGISEVVARVPQVGVLAPAGAPYGYDHRPVRDGEQIELGDVVLEFLHTPGHTPEHVSVLLRNADGDGEPVALLSGGALLVGAVARTDLLGGGEVARESARALARALEQKVLPLPDEVAIYPTHVAGSLCGGNIGAELSTTLGRERLANPLLALASDPERFADEVLRPELLPAVPPYWKRMRPQNMGGPPLLGELAASPALPVGAFREEVEAGTLVLDARPPSDFASAHVPGALNVELGSSFATWAGTVLPEGASTLLVLRRPEDLWEATWQLLRIGYPSPAGWLEGGVDAWRDAGEPVQTVPRLSEAELQDALEGDAVTLVDVRQPSEWAGGRIEGSRCVSGAELVFRIDELPADRPVALVCGGGQRSSTMASVLARAGRNVFDVPGGVNGWRKAGYPLVV